jgi:hypothetical protein
MTEPEPNTDEMSQHLRRLVSLVLEIDEGIVESKVQAVPCEDGSYICHLSLQLNGKEPTKEQERAIIFALQRFGFPGIRVTSLRVPAEA